MLPIFLSCFKFPVSFPYLSNMGVSWVYWLWICLDLFVEELFMVSWVAPCRWIMVSFQRQRDHSSVLMASVLIDLIDLMVWIGFDSTRYTCLFYQSVLHVLPLLCLGQVSLWSIPRTSIMRPAQTRAAWAFIQLRPNWHVSFLSNFATILGLTSPGSQ